MSDTKEVKLVRLRDIVLYHKRALNMERARVREAIEKIVGMVQMPSSIKRCNPSMYKDEVTRYRQTIYIELMKLLKELEK